jgi:regulatory protein RepA
MGDNTMTEAISGADMPAGRALINSKRHAPPPVTHANGYDEHDDEAPPWLLPPAISEDEMRTARLTPRCIVENYIFADVGVLIAPGSTGKTTMVLYEAMCIALGMPLWGLTVFTPGLSIIVTAEDRREYLVARIREIGKAMDLSEERMKIVRRKVLIDDRTTSICRLTKIVEDSVMASRFAHDIVNGCQQADVQPVMVLFDPMVSFGVGEARVNDAEQGLIEAGRIISNGLECATRYVHHTGKANAREGTTDQYSGRGGSALADGCRMVAVMHAVEPADLRKATGEHLEGDQSAFALDRPKLSYAPRQRTSIYVRRTGYAFEQLMVREHQTGDARAATIGEQLARFLESELNAGRKHTRHTLEDLKPENLMRQELRAGLAWLESSGRLLEVEIFDSNGKRPAKGKRTYLQPCAPVRRSDGEAMP